MIKVFRDIIRRYLMQMKEKDLRGTYQTKEWSVVEKTRIKKFKRKNFNWFSRCCWIKCVIEWVYDGDDAS